MKKVRKAQDILFKAMQVLNTAAHSLGQIDHDSLTREGQYANAVHDAIRAAEDLAGRLQQHYTKNPMQS